MATTTERGYGAAWQKLCEEAYRVYGYTCWICGGAIDPSLPARHPWSKSVDHLDPIATHGTAVPTIDRVRPAHLKHNQSRGAGAPPNAAPHANTYSRSW